MFYILTKVQDWKIERMSDSEDNLPSLESEIEELKEQLKGVINADMSGESSSKLVYYVREREARDPLVTDTGSQQRWVINPVKATVTENKGDRQCCTII